MENNKTAGDHFSARIKIEKKEGNTPMAETLPKKGVVPGRKKKFTVSDLWNIHQQRRHFFSNRDIFLN